MLESNGILGHFRKCRKFLDISGEVENVEKFEIKSLKIQDLEIARFSERGPCRQKS